MFRRLSQIITPPVAKGAPQPYIPPQDREPDLGTQLKPVLKRLVAAPSLDDPGAQASLAEIKRIALTHGLYLTAFEIRSQLDTMPKADEAGTPYDKRRGYVLAGDFFLAHIRRELEALKGGGPLVGPNIYRGYCDEMIECLLRSANVRRAIEMPAMVLEELLLAVIVRPERAQAALELATQTAGSMRALVSNRYERQSEPGSRSGISTIDLRSPFAALDEGCMAYAEDTRYKVRELRNRVDQYLGEQAKKGPATLVDHTQACLTIAKSVRHHPFSAMVLERAASLVSGDSDKAAMFWRNAGAFWEEQGDIEVDLFLTKLSGQRYHRAEACYTRGGDTDGAARTARKASDAALRGKH